MVKSDFSHITLNLKTKKTIAGRQTPPGKIMFQAKVATSSLENCTIETVIDGIRLRGVIFPTKTGGDNNTRSVYFTSPYPVVDRKIHKWLVDWRYI